MEYSIKLNNISKEYKLYKDDKDRFKDLFFGKRYSPYRALNNLSLSLPKGEVIGILGKNGSGKSTILKMVAGVVFPSSGDIEVNGSVSALLELTAGFDGELTGRENIYLKGYGLGFDKKYIESKMDDIIDFAEIGEYIDQPVRMYSSGMKSRLGFAISINIDPEILVVDEVLAVGDEIFRKKCMNRMNEFKMSGRTILFVSHSIGQIKSFCTKGMWLHKGELVYYDDIEKTARLYEQYLKGTDIEEILENPSKYLNIVAIKQYLSDVDIQGNKTILEGVVGIDLDFDFNVSHLELRSPDINIKVAIKDQFEFAGDKLKYKVEIDNEKLPDGEYNVYLHVGVEDKIYSRQVWCANESGKYLDSKNNIQISIDKNRMLIKK